MGLETLLIGSLIGVGSGLVQAGSQRRQAAELGSLGRQTRADFVRAGELQAEAERLGTELEQAALRESSAEASQNIEELNTARQARIDLEENLARVTEQQAQATEIGGLETRALREAETFEKAQEALGKTKDDAVSNIEASRLRQEGLITDAEEAFITELNATELGAVETIKGFRETAQARLGGIEQQIVQDFTEAGILSEEALTGAAGKAIASITGLTDEAVAGLQPFAETGRRANLQTRVLQGLATQEERQEFETRFGGVQESPGFQFRREEAEKAEIRRQRSLGQVFSGRGQEQFFRGVVDRIAAEESERQLRNAQTQQQLGLGASSQIAGLRGQQGLAVGGLQAQTGVQLARNILDQSRQIGQVQQTLGLAGLNLDQQSVAQLLGLQTQFGLLGAQAQQGGLLGRAGVEQQSGQQITNLLSQFGVQGAQLGLQAGQLGAQRGAEISGAQAEGQRRLGDIGLLSSQQRGSAEQARTAGLGQIDIAQILGLAQLGAQSQRQQAGFRSGAIQQGAQAQLGLGQQQAQLNQQASIAPFAGGLAGLGLGIQAFPLFNQR